MFVATLEGRSDSGFGIVPARPYKPGDKTTVENAAQVAQRRIVAALRHYKFFSLEELNAAIDYHMVFDSSVYSAAIWPWREQMAVRAAYSCA